MPDNEKQLEQDIESFLISPAGGCRKRRMRATGPRRSWRWIWERWWGLSRPPSPSSGSGLRSSATPTRR